MEPQYLKIRNLNKDLDDKSEYTEYDRVRVGKEESIVDQRNSTEKGSMPVKGCPKNREVNVQDIRTFMKNY